MYTARVPAFRRGVVDRTNVSRDRRSPKLQQRCRNGREGRGTQSPARVAITWIAHGVRETADVPVRGKRRARPSKASGVGLVETAGRRSGDPPAKGRGFSAMPRDAGAGKRQTGDHPAERSQRTTPTRAKNRRVREALWPTQSAAERQHHRRLKRAALFVAQGRKASRTTPSSLKGANASLAGHRTRRESSGCLFRLAGPELAIVSPPSHVALRRGGLRSLSRAKAGDRCEALADDQRAGAGISPMFLA
jgi:hypothetical protein